MAGEHRTRIDWQTLVMTALATVVSVMLAYGALTSRIEVLEDRYERLVQDVKEIKDDVKTLLQRTRP